MDWNLIILVAVVAWFGLQFMRARNRITGQQARELIAGGALLVDVRSEGEFAGGHIDGALNIPVNQLKARVAELGDKARPVVLYCASGMRSGGAARSLRAMGFTAVHDLGPMGRWRS